MQNQNIVDQSYWDQSYENYKYKEVDRYDPVRKHIEKFFSNQKVSKDVFEVGCYPGRYLEIFGQLGCRLNGIDITPRIETDFQSFLINQGYIVGDLIAGFFPQDLIEGKKYDIVTSIGFIEHFEDFENIILEHTKIVTKGGYLLIYTPNFAHGFQLWFHKRYDTINLLRHVLQSMNPYLRANIIEKEGFDVIDSGYMGGFDFWFDHQKRSLLDKIIIYPLYVLKEIINKIGGLFGITLHNLPNNKNRSSYCFIVAKKI